MIDLVLRTLTYFLKPTKAQSLRLFHFLSTGRKLFNHSLEQRIKYYKETGKSLSYYDQQADLTVLRSVSQVMRDLPVWIARDALRRLDNAFKHFFRRVKEKNGKAGFPRFKSANRWNSFSVGQPGKVIRMGNRIRVTGLDSFIRARGVRLPQGKIKEQRIVLRAGKWHCKLVVDDGLAKPPAVPVKSAIGIDVGLMHFLTDSNGEHVANPRFYRKMERKLAHAHRNVSRKNKGSKNRRRAVSRLQRVYAHISDQRWYFTHCLSKQTIAKHQLIAVEKLAISNMVRGRFSKGILDAAWGQFLQQLHYKAESAGVTVVDVNPRGTSQECSKCGDLVLKDLSVRIHSCPSCGLVLDRDHNAARNILQRALRESAPALDRGDTVMPVERSNGTAAKQEVQTVAATR